MRRSPFLRLLCLSGLALLLAGCGSGTKLGGVAITALSIRTATPATPQPQAILNLRFTNENVVPVGLSGGRHRLYINGKAAGQALSREPLGLPQLSTATQEVTVTLEPGFLASIAGATQASYRLESVLFVTAGEERMDIKTQSQGAIDVSALR